MARLATYVHVQDEKGEPFVFGPPDTVPAWAEKAIANPKAWAEAPEPEQDAAPAGNASTEAWQAYATSKGATAKQIEGKSRDELRAQFGN